MQVNACISHHKHLHDPNQHVWIQAETDDRTSNLKDSNEGNSMPKRRSDALSPANNEKTLKRANTDLTPETSTQPNSDETRLEEVMNQSLNESSQEEKIDLKEFLLEEFKLLRSNINSKFSEIKEELKGVITQQSIENKETTKKLELQILNNSTQISTVTEENRRLKKENDNLEEWIGKIEQAQMSNNMIITGMQEEPWEKYDIMKERVAEAISGTMGQMGDEAMMAEARKIKISSCSRVGDEAMMAEARKIKISSCSRVGNLRLNKSCPISVTFQ